MLPRDQTVDVTPTCRWVKEFHAVTNVLTCAIKLNCLGCIKAGRCIVCQQLGVTNIWPSPRWLGKAHDSATLQKHIRSDKKTSSLKYYCPSARVTVQNQNLSDYSAW